MFSVVKDRYGGIRVQTDVQVMYTQEELAKMEIQNFVNEGLKDVQNNDLYDADEVFDELESRYKDAVV